MFYPYAFSEESPDELGFWKDGNWYSLKKLDPEHRWECEHDDCPDWSPAVYEASFSEGGEDGDSAMYIYCRKHMIELSGIKDLEE